mmetsp:Transcript_52426/g.121906  ORF Transcript_52426/g.121906 Transcript_52426/m.121906 type:complete len:295 (+) Transcript_52426:82-966(+)
MWGLCAGAYTSEREGFLDDDYDPTDPKNLQPASPGEIEANECKRLEMQMSRLQTRLKSGQEISPRVALHYSTVLEDLNGSMLRVKSNGATEGATPTLAHTDAKPAKFSWSWWAGGFPTSLQCGRMATPETTSSPRSDVEQEALVARDRAEQGAPVTGDRVEQGAPVAGDSAEQEAPTEGGYVELEDSKRCDTCSTQGSQGSETDSERPSEGTPAASCAVSQHGSTNQEALEVGCSGLPEAAGSMRVCAHLGGSAHQEVTAPQEASSRRCSEVGCCGVLEVLRSVQFRARRAKSA